MTTELIVAISTGILSLIAGVFGSYLLFSSNMFKYRSDERDQLMTRFKDAIDYADKQIAQMREDMGQMGSKYEALDSRLRAEIRKAEVLAERVAWLAVTQFDPPYPYWLCSRSFEFSHINDAVVRYWLAPKGITKDRLMNNGLDGAVPQHVKEVLIACAEESLASGGGLAVREVESWIEAGGMYPERWVVSIFGIKYGGAVTSMAGIAIPQSD